VTCESCIGSHFKCHQSANYGSSMVKTAKIILFPTLRLDMDFTIKYTNGKSREFFQIGVSGNKTGISVYILGLKDKKYLAKTYGKKLGKASVTGYCIRFKALKDINIDTLEAAIRYGLAAQNEKGELMK
jgi:hypothetical protein